MLQINTIRELLKSERKLRRVVRGPSAKFALTHGGGKRKFSYAVSGCCETYDRIGFEYHKFFREFRFSYLFGSIPNDRTIGISGIVQTLK